MGDTTIRPSLTRWSETAAPEEGELRARMAAEGLRPYSWANEGSYVYGEHDHPYHKVLYVARGSIRFVVDDTAFDMGPGDRLDLPSGIRHSAYVGSEGVTCLEATR